MKRNVMIFVVCLILGIIAYYLVQFYRMSKGVKEDAIRMENFEILKKFKLNDSVMVVTDTTVID